MLPQCNRGTREPRRASRRRSGSLRSGLLWGLPVSGMFTTSRSPASAGASNTTSGGSDEIRKVRPVRACGRARRRAARGTGGPSGAGDGGSARGSRGDGTAACGEHPGCSGHDHRLHGLRDPQCRHHAPRGFHRADAGRVGGPYGRSRRHAGQHPRHQYRPRCRAQLRARRGRGAADQPDRAQPGTGERHADRGAQGSAGRSLRPQRGGRRLHRHDAQAWRGT